MPATFAELLTPVTEDEAEELILGLLEAVGFPATSWRQFSVPRTLVKLFARLYADSRTGITNIVKSRLLDYAEGDALTYLARNLFNKTREPAVATEGTFLLRDTGGAPYDIEPGQLVVRVVDSTTLRYTNTTGGTLDVGGELTLTFRAEQTGEDFNIPTGTALEFAETLEGVEVATEADDDTGTWIATAGADEQSDESLREACRAQWGTLGAGTEAAYVAWALEGAPTVTKVRVLGDEVLPAGSVRVLLATDTGSATSAQVDAADAVVQAKRPRGLRECTVLAASPSVVTIDATVNVYSGASDYLTRLTAARQEYQSALQIGERIYLTSLDALLHEPGNVRNVVLTSPAADTVIDLDEIHVLQLGNITVNTVTR